MKTMRVIEKAKGLMKEDFMLVGAVWLYVGLTTLTALFILDLPHAGTSHTPIPRAITEHN